MKGIRGRILRRIVHALALSVSLGTVEGCQRCLEFGCSGGFVWVGLVPAEAKEVQVHVDTLQTVFAHTCTLAGEAGEATKPEDPCSLEVERADPGSTENSLAFAGLDEDGVAQIRVHTFQPRAEDLGWTDASGPETVLVEVRLDGALVLNETYEPDYLEQSKGPGCGVCEHQDSVTVDFRE